MSVYNARNLGVRVSVRLVLGLELGLNVEERVIVDAL